jgi:hypothetical protein
MSEKETLPTDKQNEKQGFWSSLSFTDYIELAVYVFVAGCLIMGAVEYFR